MTLLDAASRCAAAGDMLGAEQRLRAVIAADPTDVSAWDNLAILLVLRREQYAVAEIAIRHALAISPGDPWALSTLGLVLKQVFRYDEAVSCFDESIAVLPGWPGPMRTDRDIALRDTLLNRALTKYEMGDLQGSDSDFADAKARIDDQNWQATISKDQAYPVLASGDLPRGFALMEHRWHKLLKSLIWDMCPEWQGEDLKGKTLLVHQDQGHGDVIQFSRYMSSLSALGASRIWLAVDRPLIRLMQPNGYNYVVADRDHPPIADYHVPICSLPYHLGVTLDKISGSPYLLNPGLDLPLPDRTKKLRVGIVWAAQQRLIGPRRSIPLETLLSLALIPEIKLYSLQFGPSAADIDKIGADLFVTDLSYLIRDFADTATLMSQLDLVISADTASLHLAGALGIRCIGFSDHVPCWRWLRGRSDTPWYDSMTLTAQNRPGDWSPVVDAIRDTIERTLYANNVFELRA